MARYVRKLIAVLLMVTALIVTQIPAVDVDAARIDIGDYTMDGDILVKYNGTEATVTVPNSVRTIGHEAFADNTHLTEVILPESVTKVDFSSFEDCTNLSKVVMGTQVKTIGASAFSGCTALKSVSIPAKTSEIGSGAFAKCSSLTNINIDPNNEHYICKDGVLYTIDQSLLVQYLAGKPSASFTMPSTVKKIGEYAFWGAELLTGVTISSGVKEIPEYAFDNCNGLSIVTIPSSVESLQAYSFGDCVNLKEIRIPKSVGYIDEMAFACSDNTVIQFMDSSGNPIASDTVKPNGTDTEGTVSGNTANGNQTKPTTTSETSAIYDYVDFSENVLPGELGAGRIVGGNVLVMMSSDQAVRGVDLSGAETEDGIAGSGNHGSYIPGDYDIITGVLAGYHGGDSDVTLPVNVTRIGDRVFYKNDTLNSVNIPTRTTSIGDFAFARSGLSSVTIPEGVTDIGYAAFYHCNKLSNVTIPATITHIALGAFEGTPWLSGWMSGNDGNDFLVVGDGILLAYRGLGSDVVIPSGVKTIGAECFKGNASVSGVSIPEGVETIGEDAFNGCSSLHTVHLPQSLVKIEDRAFADCPLEQIEIPAGVQEIGLGAFDATAIGSPMQTIVFEGNILPKVSYNPTATRLSGENLRKLALQGVINAIIPKDTEIADESILGPQSYGFRGLVYSISGESAGTEAGTLELQSCTLLPDSTTGVVTIDPHARISGADYIMTGVRQKAFSPYQTVEEWSGLKLTDIQVQGNASEGLMNLISDISFASTGGSTSLDTPITISSSRTGMDRTDLMSALIPGNENTYQLTITEGEQSEARADQALAAEYSTIKGAVIFPMEITLSDPISDIPITKLAANKMELCLPIPSVFQDTTDVEIGAIGTNGTLERLSSEIVDLGGTNGIKFVASHFSTYVIYKMSETATKESQDLQNSLADAKQGSGNYIIQTLSKGTGGIHPKWYVAGLLALFAVILFCMKSHKRS